MPPLARGKLTVNARAPYPQHSSAARSAPGTNDGATSTGASCTVVASGFMPARLAGEEREIGFHDAPAASYARDAMEQFVQALHLCHEGADVILAARLPCLHSQPHSQRGVVHHPDDAGGQRQG